jgi:hypothetical protein
MNQHLGMASARVHLPTTVVTGAEVVATSPEGCSCLGRVTRYSDRTDVVPASSRAMQVNFGSVLTGSRLSNGEGIRRSVRAIAFRYRL